MAVGWNVSHGDKSAAERGYGWAWKKKRDRIMKRDSGLCQPCMKTSQVSIATEVDHIINKAAGGTDDDTNLQAICDDCHKAKTAKERTGAYID